MSQSDERSSAAVFLSEHPDLKASMAESKVFEELKKRSLLRIDEEQLYVVRGDTLGDEDELYLDALIRGSNPEASDDLSRKLFLELDEKEQALIRQRHEGS